MKKPDRVLLGHGGGGLMTHRLVTELFLRHLESPALARLEDAARLGGCAAELALTTDAFVVEPLFFPGGDIGKLAVCGTVNDLLVSGARPLALAAAFILEEGLPMADLERIVESMAQTAREAGVPVVTGDTKVVPRGKGGGCFVTTTGLGAIAEGARLAADGARAGDAILVTGPVGQHGATILAARAGIAAERGLASDCAPLTPLLGPLLAAPEGLHVMRDPTRGGLGTTLCELAGSSKVELQIDEQAVPISDSVLAASELLGLDPLLLACEGRAVIIAAPEAARRALDLLRGIEAGREARIIGGVREGPPRVVLRTAMGGRRLITMPASDMLPRIC
jgi:hydrogenase expression/formation protein HypE